jgi:hypothetical protein
MKNILPVLLLCLCFSIVTVSAQMVTNPTQWYVNNQIASMNVFNSVVANSTLRSRMKGGKTRQKSAKTETKTVAPDYTVFRASSNNSLPKTLAAKSGGNSQNQAKMEQLFDSFIKLYKDTAAKDGFPANDLAYGFEYFVVNNYQIYNDLYELPLEKDPRARRVSDGFDKITAMSQKKLLMVTMFQEQQIYNHFRETLGASPDMKKMTDAQKQEATELLAIMFGVNYNLYVKGINDDNDALLDQARKMAQDGLEKLLNVPANQIKITTNGLEF